MLKRLRSYLLMNNVNVNLKAINTKLKEKLEERCIFSFSATTWDYKISLLSVPTKSHFSFTIQTEEKIEDHLHVHVSFVKNYSQKLTTKAYKAKKSHYDYLLNIYRTVVIGLFLLAKDEGKKGLIISYENYLLDESLANYFRNKLETVSPSNYREETVEVVRNVTGLNVLGLILKDQFVEQTLSSLEAIHKVKEIIREHPLLSLESPNYNEALKILNNDISVYYAGVTLSWSLVNNEELAIKPLTEDVAADIVRIDEREVEEYLNNLMEENKFRILLSKPMWNFHTFIYELKNVSNIPHVSNINSFYFNKKTIEREFLSLEEVLGSWESVEALFIKIRPQYKEGKYKIKEYTVATQGELSAIVFTFEFNIDGIYIYFVMKNKIVNKNTDDLTVIVSDVQAPREMNELLIKLLA